MAGKITEIILATVDRYQREYNIDAYHINCGNCEDFAQEVLDELNDPNAELAWHWEMEDCSDDEVDEYAHCFIIFNGLFYDSQSPHGVNSWRELSALKPPK